MNLPKSTCKLHLAGGLLLLVLGMWLNSGTLSPYAAGLPKPNVLPDCGYLANLDHDHFLAVPAMLDGKERETWINSPVLRRVLYPTLFYPAYKVFGILWGGLLTNILLHAGSFIFFWRWATRRYSIPTANNLWWILCSYPGFSYWGGLPYAYALIVPSTIVAFCLLHKLNEAESEKSVALTAFAMGLIFLGYDLFTVFLPAAVLVLARRKRWLSMLLTVPLIMLPNIAVLVLQNVLWDIPTSNANTSIFGVVLSSYLHKPDFAVWGWLLKISPAVFLHNVFFSNFLVLPAVFFLLLGKARREAAIAWPELALIASLCAFWAFNNFAPPYEGWPLRGYWIARLYQPAFVVLAIGCARMIGQTGMYGRILMGFLIAGQLLIMFSGVTHNRLASRVIHEFYWHTPAPRPASYQNNLDHFGRRPLGFCPPQTDPIN